MKLSNSLIAIAVVAALPLAAIAGDKDKMSTPQATSAQFEKLDSNRDGRISQSEAVQRLEDRVLDGGQERRRLPRQQRIRTSQHVE